MKLFSELLNDRRRQHNFCNNAKAVKRHGANRFPRRERVLAVGSHQQIMQSNHGGVWHRC